MDQIGPGIYLHVPFCLSKCRYCSFYSCTDAPTLIPPYLQAAGRAIERLGQQPPWDAQRFSTIFFGGGTPSLLPPSLLTGLLSQLRQRFAYVEGPEEISIEVNPATIDLHGLTALLDAGFNRLSIGIQCLDEQQLIQLGRPHNARQALTTFAAARKAGFTNISIDLMYGLPGQTPEQWNHDLDRVLALAPEHLSIYELTMEPGTPMAKSVQQGRLALPDEEAVLEMMARTRETTAAGGWEQYEISNFARPGHRCRHNLNYWHNGTYLGIGPAAVSAWEGTRWHTPADLQGFITQVMRDGSPPVEVETLDREAYFRETVMIGLRLTAGIDLEALHHRFGIDAVVYYGATLDRLCRQGLLVCEHDRLRLSTRGLPLANRVMAELV